MIAIDSIPKLPEIPTLEKVEVALKDIEKAKFVHIGKDVYVTDDAVAFILENKFSFDKSRANEFKQRYEAILEKRRLDEKLAKIGFTSQELKAIIND